MKKHIYFLALLLLSVCIAGCVGTGKKSAVAESSTVPFESTMSAPEAAGVAESAEQVSGASSTEGARSAGALTPETMTKKDVQTALQKAGFYKGAIDGKYGPKTRVAIKEFQKENGLQADGLVGKKTKAALLKYLN